jgi:flagellar biosynthesis protein FlhG
MTAIDHSGAPPARRLRRPRRRIAIASGKGGVGKTWLAVTLAQAFAEQGERVLLFDGDLGLANVDIQLGLTPAQDLSGVLAGRIPLGDAITRVSPGGFDVLPGRSGSGSFALLAAPRLESLLAALDGLDYSVILLDLGAGLEAHTRRMAAHADILLTVATEEPTSLTDAYAVLKLFMMDKPGGDARLVVNQANSQSAGRRTFDTLSQACRQFLRIELPLAGIVRRDDHVRETIRRQTPLLTRHPGCQAAADIRGIAASLLT